MTFLRSQKRILRLGATNWSEWREVYEGSTSGQMSQVLDHCGPLKPNLDSSLTKNVDSVPQTCSTIPMRRNNSTLR
jgi:hypothetical protein